MTKILEGYEPLEAVAEELDLSPRTLQRYMRLGWPGVKWISVGRKTYLSTQSVRDAYIKETEVAEREVVAAE